MHPLRVQGCSGIGAFQVAAQPGAEESGGAAGEVQGESKQLPRSPPTASSLGKASREVTVAWEIQVDLGKQLVFAPEITQTTLGPDIVICSTAAKKLCSSNLPHPWRKGYQQHEFKQLKYSELAAECYEAGWTATIHPLEVGALWASQPTNF